MVTDNKETRVRQPRQFGRTYDYSALTAAITAAFASDFNLTLEVSKVPAETQGGFVLQSIADYVVGEGTEAMREKLANETDEQQRARAIQAINEAWAEVVEGKVDFRTGSGLGGMRSVIGALGQVLFELGKTFVKNQRGEVLSFTDIHSAREAVKTLYNDTEPKGPFAPMLDAQNQPVLDKAGKQRMKAVNEDSHLTGRMVFNALTEHPAVKPKLEAILGTDKKKAVEVDFG